jgi:hypothetical protein
MQDALLKMKLIHDTCTSFFASWEISDELLVPSFSTATFDAKAKILVGEEIRDLELAADAALLFSAFMGVLWEASQWPNVEDEDGTGCCSATVMSW